MTKGQLTKRCRAILDSVKCGETIAQADADWLTENIFPYTANWAWYTDRGITHITKDKADHGTECFYIHFAHGDLKHSSISYIKCINNKIKKQ